jgi:integrase
MFRQRKSDGRWEGRITFDGKPFSVYGETRQEAQGKLELAKRQREQGIPRLDERQTVEQYLRSWLANYEATVRYDTWRRASQYVELHIIPVIGRVRLARLTAQQVQALYADRMSKGLSPSTVRHLHAVLHKALKSAERLGLVARNVASAVDAPRMRHHEMRCFSREEARRLLAETEASGDRLHALYTLAVSTGMRLGELLALRWKDVDLERDVLRVTATLKRDKEDQWVWTEPKTRRSRRQIALSPVAVAALRAHRARQREERLKVGAAWSDYGLVFCTEAGTPLYGGNVYRAFKRLQARAGLPEIRFHDLRHTCATMLLAGRVNPKVVSEMLGHASVAITLDIYSHVLPDMQQDAAVVMGSLLTGS